MEENIITVEDLHKTYGKDVLSVDETTFNPKTGEVFGYLGPNKAGKRREIS
jgi:ABC-type multidrug transport system ATPase subunit